MNQERFPLSAIRRGPGDMGLGLSPVTSTPLSIQAYCNSVLEALMESRSQDSAFLRTAGGLPSTARGRARKTLPPSAAQPGRRLCLPHSPSNWARTPHPYLPSTDAPEDGRETARRCGLPTASFKVWWYKGKNIVFGRLLGWNDFIYSQYKN